MREWRNCARTWPPCASPHHGDTVFTFHTSRTRHGLARGQVHQVFHQLATGEWKINILLFAEVVLEPVGSSNAPPPNRQGAETKNWIFQFPWLPLTLSILSLFVNPQVNRSIAEPWCDVKWKRMTFRRSYRAFFQPKESSPLIITIYTLLLVVIFKLYNTVHRSFKIWN